MPTVAIAEGVEIQLFARERPPPRFHAVGAEPRAPIEIAALAARKSNLPPAKLRLVIGWAGTRREALQAFARTS